MIVHIGNSVGAVSPDRIGELSGRFMAAFSSRLLAGLDRKLAQVAAKKRPAAKARVALKPAAKPMNRAARLRQAEAEVRANQPRDARCCWRDMRTG
jgi:hypothetical protein